MLPSPLKILNEKFGRFPMNGTDLVSLCDDNHIELILTRDAERGFYYFGQGQHTIVLSTKLDRDERKIVGYHEFGHFLQNYDDRQVVAAFSDVDKNSPSEKLADVFSLIATRPDHIRITDRIDFLLMLMNRTTHRYAKRPRKIDK